MDIKSVENFKLPKEIKIIKQIGKGGFSVVYKILYKENIKAMKIVKNNKIFENEYMNLNEYNVLKKLDHANIIKLDATIFKKFHTYFIFDYYKAGNLSKFMKKLKEKNIDLKENEIRIVMLKIIKGLNYIHNKNIIHRDIKPDNILIDSFRTVKNLVISDFGLATIKNNEFDFNYYEKCGTKYYMAPEVIKGEKYDFKADIWSLGIILFMFLNNYKNPLRKYEKNELIKILSNNWKPDIDSLKCSFLLKNLLSKIFVINFKERYNINQILNHPWIQNNDKLSIPFTKSETINIINTLLKTKQILKFMLILSLLEKKNKNQLKINFLKKKNVSRTNKSLNLKNENSKVNELIISNKKNNVLLKKKRFISIISNKNNINNNNNNNNKKIIKVNDFYKDYKLISKKYSNNKKIKNYYINIKKKNIYN